jgi:hypothetical protein
MQKRPALISITRGLPARSSLRSMLKIPDALGSIDRTTRSHNWVTAGSYVILARAGVEDIPLNWLKPPK